MQKLSLLELGRLSKDDAKKANKNNIIIVLENIRSAYNIGSVFRTADAFLIEAVYLIGYCALPPHKEIKKTALGAEESVEWLHFETTLLAIEHLKKINYEVYAVEQTDSPKYLHQFNKQKEQNIAVIMGNEVNGVEQSTIENCLGCIEIPQFGAKHSLNIASAASVVLWELVKPNFEQ